MDKAYAPGLAIKIEYYGGMTEIVSIEEAKERFKKYLDTQSWGWLLDGGVVGTGCGSNQEVRMLWRYTKEERIADAAPELLEAAKIGLSWCESEEGSDHSDGDKIRAAIAKAEGPTA